MTKFLSNSAIIRQNNEAHHYYAAGKNQVWFEETIAITAPPSVLYNSGRYIYFSLSNLIANDLSKHQYLFLLSRFEERYFQRYEGCLTGGYTATKYAYPKYLYFLIDSEKISPGFDFVLPNEFIESIKLSGEPLKGNFISSEFMLERHRYDVSDSILEAIADCKIQSIQIGYDYRLSNPLLAEKEYVDIEVSLFSRIIKESIFLMKQAIMEKISKYQDFDQSSIWGLLE